MTNSSKSVVATVVGIVVTVLMFSLEALLHYNIGATGHITFTHFPSRKELVRIITVVVIFALLSEVITVLLQYAFFGESEGVGLPFAAPEDIVRQMHALHPDQVDTICNCQANPVPLPEQKRN